MKRVYKFRDFYCIDDHKTSKFVEEGIHAVPCDMCGEPAVTKAIAVTATAAMHGDALDYVDHNLGKEPIHIRSKSERRRLMQERGLIEFVRHTPVPGTDKSPHTTDFSKGSIDAVTLENARILVSRQAEADRRKGDGSRVGEASEEPGPVSNPFNYEATPEQVRSLNEAINASGSKR